MKQAGYAIAYGAGTIINAISTWKGAAFGIDLKTQAEVILTDNKEIIGYMEEGGDTTLIERSVELTLSRFGSKTGAKVATKSQIPIASGLKSSSAAANATVLATLDALGEKLEPLEVIKIGVQAALDAKVTITGAFDDACASMLGGFVITDNKKKELIKREERDSQVLILAPGKRVLSSGTNVLRSRLIGKWVEMAYKEAIAGNYEKAMTLNGFLYCAALGFSTDPMMMALELGIDGVSLSGTGPAYTALGSPELLDKLEPVWERFGGKVIRTKVNNSGGKACL
ncbi:MAG: shikimate kinase [Candidatus Methanoperedens nitroreducens]|uniref:Shikimate kinase n=1 Tax=Candidatus Methanoperedens nitratireducens TaxID=1392998 RepID=A0A0P7ZEJ9_9EURY|nr:shikimate kinase [Candidatus Methanoperedens sp. BLZ2]KAB2947327.1 MAG: shikimate kinase [Candidatus Methanoperedens sp.]KPQ43120.1 MAG: shikimate kinase [Candidatus Methanoperedens sp. BLZ1]MBZ0175530.1 shikimate kinase [Candidatus Methanoperedens nitroreducens]CAG1002626.1 shikimate kinase [Methanosarcinales archaeon]MCX9080262.1 shikimate kinase [Candidatus Methanoperedens sp.]